MENIVVYTGDAWEALIIRYLLNKDGIETWVTNKKFESVGQTSDLPDAWEPLTVKVSDLDYERAKLIVVKFEKNAQDDKNKFKI